VSGKVSVVSSTHQACLKICDVYSSLDPGQGPGLLSRAVRVVELSDPGSTPSTRAHLPKSACAFWSVGDAEAAAENLASAGVAWATLWNDFEKRVAILENKSEIHVFVKEEFSEIPIGYVEIGSHEIN
jgi:hypothetical protein